MTPRSATAYAATLLALSGCAPTGDFPSLAPRPIEYRLSGRPLPPCLDNDGRTLEPEPAPVAPTADDTALAARIQALSAAAREGQTAFARGLLAAEASAARAGAAGSESWIAAQQDISALASARATTADAVASLDALGVERGQQPLSDADRAALEAALAEAQRLADEQQAILDRLNATVGN